MDNRLILAVERAIGARWRHDQHTIPSESIYDDLIAHGYTIPEGAMSRILQTFLVGGDIGAARILDREAIAKHGGMLITVLRPDFG
jgi:hypothetical protein